MKRIIILIAAVAGISACNSKKEGEKTPDTGTTGGNTATATTAPPESDYKPTYNLTFTADGVEIANTASLLVTKDKDKLKADAPYLCMLTSNAAKNNNEYLTINFLLDTKPGTYPVVGASFSRGDDKTSEMFGGMLGGKPTLTEFKVTLTECKDLGSNNMGGHKWSISGNWEGIVIKALPLMLLDKTKPHPAEVKLEKGSFTNLSFDDNWEQLMEEGLKKLKESKK